MHQNTKNRIASFETNHFSTYVLTEKVDENNNADTITVDADAGTNNNNPQTGDNIIFFAGMLIIALIGIPVTDRLRKSCKTK